MQTMKKLADVKGLGTVVEECADFVTELQSFKEANVELITPRNEAYARIKTAGEIGRIYGTRTTAGVEYVKGELPILRLRSRLLLDPELAKLVVGANRGGRYFSTDSKKEYEESLKQAEKDNSKAPSKRKVIVLPSRERFDITKDDYFYVLKFLLRGQADKYFKLNGKDSIPFYLVDKGRVDAQEGTLLTQVWVGSLGNRSGLSGDDGSLGYGSRARGVQKSGVATQKKSSQKVEAYTPRQIGRVLREQKLAGLEEQVINGLRGR